MKPNKNHTNKQLGEMKGRNFERDINHSVGPSLPFLAHDPVCKGGHYLLAASIASLDE